MPIPPHSVPSTPGGQTIALTATLTPLPGFPSPAFHSMVRGAPMNLRRNYVLLSQERQRLLIVRAVLRYAIKWPIDKAS